MVFIQAQKILLFAGTLDYLPNAKAVENIYKEIAPGYLKRNLTEKLLFVEGIKQKNFNTSTN
jgi:hypothetical protein